MAEHQPDLRSEVEAAVLAELERVGPDALNKAELVKRYADRGASRATLYRYVDGVLKSGKGSQHLARQINAATAARAQEPDPPAAAAAAAKPHLPAVVKVQDVGRGGGPIAVMEKLSSCVQIAEQLIAYARTDDGKVRSARILMAASEHLRRTMETAVRIQERLTQEEEMARFHASILGVVEEVARQHPEVAEIIVRRLGNLAADWGG